MRQIQFPSAFHPLYNEEMQRAPRLEDPVDQWCVSHRLSPSHGFQTLNVINPVVFLDFPFGTVHVELYAHTSPVLCRNVYELCLGSQKRLVNGVSVPAGYTGCTVYDAVPGVKCTTGDVTVNDGRGVFSVFGNGGPFRVALPFQPSDATAVELNRKGLVVLEVVRQVDDVSGAMVDVGSSFSIYTDPPREAVSMAVVGRVTGRTTQEYEKGIETVQRTSVEVFKLKKNNNSSALPKILNSGEM